MKKITCLIPKGTKKPYFITNDVKEIMREFSTNTNSHWIKKFICEMEKEGVAVRCLGSSHRPIFKVAIMFIFEDKPLFAYRWVLATNKISLFENLPEEKDFVEAYREELHYRTLLNDCLRKVKEED